MHDDEKQAQEIWESTTGGTTYIQVRDPRNPRGWVTKKVGGKGSKRITVSIEEREFNQDLVAYENQHQDPFTNGLLYRIQPQTADRSRFEVNDGELVQILKGGEDEEFEATIRKVESEVILRRMQFLAERNATMWRANLLQTVIDERYQIGKTQAVVKEIFEDDRKYAGVDL